MTTNKLIVLSFLALLPLLACGQQAPEIEMIVIAGGTFKMGDLMEEGDANELPVHEVTVGDFAIGKYPVTFDQFDRFAVATGRDKPTDEGWGRGDRPVINISWNDATAMAEWLSEQSGRSFRLPTESQWEFAARAGSSEAYGWGNTITREYANYGPADCCAKGIGQSGRDVWDYTSPVGSFEPNPWGLYDMAGNVWEFTADCWNDSYEGAPTDDSAWTTGDCTRSPLRGGSWTHYSRNLRSANRNESVRTRSTYGYGFRLVEEINARPDSRGHE
jgi:formylglycine-generating enzyme required for sulfatase activity